MKLSRGNHAIEGQNVVNIQAYQTIQTMMDLPPYQAVDRFTEYRIRMRCQNEACHDATRIRTSLHFRHWPNLGAMWCYAFKLHNHILPHKGSRLLCAIMQAAGCKKF
jgi:hypothetical protein